MMGVRLLYTSLLTKSYKIFNTQVQANSKKRHKCITNFISRHLFSTCTIANNQVDIQNLADKIALENPSFFKNYADQILSSVKSVSSSSDAVYLLKALRVQTFMKRINFEDFSSDSRFNTLCQTFENTCHSLPPSMLISGLRSFLEIGISSSSDLINGIGLVILSKIKDFSTTDLIGCLHLHSKFPSANRQKQVMKLLIQEIEQRPFEIDSEPQALMLVELLYLFESNSRKEIQEKIIKHLPRMKSKSLIKIICSLAENTKRNKNLLNTVGYQLRQNFDKPNLKETVDVLYALKTLNYLNPNVLTYLTENREMEISNVQQPSIISGLLNACGQLKWKHLGILDACGSWILQHSDKCSSRELVSYLLTTAVLNYIPKNNSIIDMIKKCLKASDVPKNIWLDVVWSLAVLNSLDKELLINVLSPDFYSTLLEDSKSSLSNKLKLLNLKSILKVLYPEFIFSCDLFLDVPVIQRSQEDAKCKQLVLETLSLFIPDKKCMCTNINSDTGVVIDAEFIMRKGKPLLLSDYGYISKPTTVTKQLPPDARRIALMIWLYKDYTLGEKTLTGVNALAVNLLKNLGFVVIEIPYGTFIKNSTLVKKVMFLSEIIKNFHKDKDVNKMK